MKHFVTLSGFRGYGRLALQGAKDITDLVEDVHSTIGGLLLGGGTATPGSTGGITGLVYGAIRGSFDLVGAGLDAVLGQIIPMADDPPSTPEREALLAAVNGVFGHHLAVAGNPLAIKMALRYGGQSLALEKGALQAAIPEITGKIVVLVHGLCMSDLGWERKVADGTHDHGAALARDAGYTPVYLHYNSGLNISTNGRRLADLLETLVAEWPQPVEDLAILGHSMGGLVSRSACHYGTLARHAWRGQLRKLIFVGTPHHGSALERIGNWSGEILKATRFTAPFRRLGQKRSAGITDLRYGNLLDEDWEGLDRFLVGPDNRRSLPLPEGVACYTIAAALGSNPCDLKARLLGDGLVPLDSALGVHEDADRCLAFSPSQQWVVYNTGHVDLLSRREVYEKIREWVG